ncbi:uncharacterized protein LOC143898432 isoform X2 [Temnothorax americanus]|uniref:uncharacterized protein LOC143898432 isoform X2 n=1 Tax=Temnothorax americanus TaxID=1964332 RepID=UPI004068D39D
MIHLGARYYSLDRLLLLAVGLWPYQQSKFAQFQFIFFSATLSAGIIFQLTPLIVLKCTSDLVTKVLSSASFFTTFIITYNAFRFNIEVVKKLLMELQHILNELRDKNEIAIAEKYSCIANRYTIALATLGVCGIFVSIIVQFWSNLINVDVPMNISHQRSRHLFIITEYFVDQEKYFYLILFHVCVGFSIGATVMVGIGAMLITYLQHTCGMFKIARYNVQWYRAPIHIQKMILFLLQKQTKEFTLSVGKLFHASMECFATLVKTSVSYFTVIYATR